MSRRMTLFLAYVACILLLAATITVAQFHLGLWNPVLNLGIAAAKAALILWFFMNLRNGSGLTRLFAGAGAIWLVILFGLGLSDYLTRGWTG